MKMILRRMIAGLLCLLLALPVLHVYAEGEGGAAEEEAFYLEGDTSGVAAMSFDNSSRLPVSNVRYQKFQCTDGTANTPACPNLGVGIKYIEGDDKNVDGGGKWRYVYCLQFSKDSPSGGQAMQHSGWTSKKIAYALYYGAVYYGKMCRYGSYSTGDWQMDYFVTQMAIHVLNNEFTMAAFWNGLNKSSASQAEKNLVYDRVGKIVNDAGSSANYGGFTSDGWLDLNTASFTLNGYQDSWYASSGLYASNGVFHPVFRSYYGYDFCEQLTEYSVQVPSGVNVRKKGSQLYADFDVTVAQSQYKQWQLTGKTLPITVKASLPRYWGGGIYRSTAGANFQDICFLTWSAAGGTASFQKSVDLHIPKVTRDLLLYKKDAVTQAPLSGAGFSLWAYDGQKYSRKIGNFTDQGDGSYMLKGIDHTSTKDGWFLIKEDKPPANYQAAYRPENSMDEEDYKVYGGREIRMNADGFISDRVQDPFTFRDEPLIPEADIEIIKYDIDTGANLEGAVFSIYEWNKDKKEYNSNPIQLMSYDSQMQTYKTTSSLTKSSDNEGKFMIRETILPTGYHCPWSKEITLTQPGSTTIKLEAGNYPGRNFTIHKKIRKDEVTWEHGNPTFFFDVWGTDLEGKEHTYHCYVELDQEKLKEQLADEKEIYLSAQTTVANIPAGVYYAKETEDVMRYILTDVQTDLKNVQIEKKNMEVVNDIQKIQALVTADLRGADGSVTFENRKVLYDEYSDNAVVTNHFVLKKS